MPTVASVTATISVDTDEKGDLSLSVVSTTPGGFKWNSPITKDGKAEISLATSVLNEHKKMVDRVSTAVANIQKIETTPIPTA